MNSVPTPLVLITLIFCSCARIISFTMDRPRPVPFVSASGSIGFVETFPNLGKIFCCDSFSVVFDRNEDTISFFCYGNEDFRFGGTEFDCIVQQVIEYLLNFAHVGMYLYRVRRKGSVDRHIFFNTGSFEGVDRALND